MSKLADLIWKNAELLRGAYKGKAAYLDVALVYDIFGFLGVLAIAAFLRERQ